VPGGAYGVAVDGVGNLFIAGGDIRKVTTDGIITTVVTSAQGGAYGVAVNGVGNLFIAGGDIRKVTTEGIITTVAGGGAADLGDGGPATSAAALSSGRAYENSALVNRHRRRRLFTE
jgi:hypothetical protein